MYKTRNIELVVNDSILYVLKESGIHMGTSTCVAHNENDQQELHWSLYFESASDADKFMKKYNDLVKPNFDLLPTGLDNDIVSIHLFSPKAEDYGMDAVKGQLEKDYTFIDEYRLNHTVNLPNDRDEDLRIMSDDEYGWGECWVYNGKDWVFTYKN